MEAFFANEKPEYVFIAAAKVGGIRENIECPADLLYINLIINANIMKAAHTTGVKKLIVLGSSCIYPVDIGQPMTEKDFLSGKPEPTNEGYAIGKIAAIELCKCINDNIRILLLVVCRLIFMVKMIILI